MSSTTSAERVFEGLRRQILCCEILPSSKIKIADICARYDVSLGPVREALSRLCADGIVRSEPQKGFSAAPISRQELSDMTAARIEVEVLCLNGAIEHGDVTWESQVIAAEYRLRHQPLASARHLDEDWARAHAEFHGALVSACPNPWLLRIRTMLYMHSERYRHWFILINANHPERDVAAEHRNLMNAALARDKAAARAAIETQFSCTTDDLIRIAEMMNITIG